MIFGGLLVATRFSHLWSSFDVLSHFTLHFAILTIAFAVAYFMPIGRVLTAIILWGLLARYFDKRVPTTEPVAAT